MYNHQRVLSVALLLTALIGLLTGCRQENDGTYTPEQCAGLLITAVNGSGDGEANAEYQSHCAHD